MPRKADEEVVARLLSKAEFLFGQSGMAAVSLRKISTAAGSGNTSAVQYHFRDLDGLITALLTKRMRELEEARTRLFSDMQASGLHYDARSLVRVLYEPLLEHRDAAGERTHARFVLALLNSPEAIRWGQAFLELQPSAVEAISMLADLLGFPLQIILERQRLIAIMVLTSIFNRFTPFDQPQMDEALVENVLSMATAAVGAPLGSGLVDHSQKMTVTASAMAEKNTVGHRS